MKSLEEFVAVIHHRIPTAAEFVEFAHSQGWSFRTGDSPAVIADRNDPLVVGFARMLSREPYRTRVLEHLAARLGAPPELPPPPGPADPQECPSCGRGADSKMRCWHCHDRPCGVCGGRTGSAFIATCNACAAAAVA